MPSRAWRISLREGWVCAHKPALREEAWKRAAYGLRTAESPRMGCTATSAGVDPSCPDQRRGQGQLDLAVDGHSGVTRSTNNRSGITKIVKRLLAIDISHIVVEATGGYEEPLLEACCDVVPVGVQSQPYPIHSTAP